MGGASLYESKLPQWIENDRKVLRFEGYYQEHVTEQPNENYRVRKVLFLYYLEDSSFQISEPRQDNSGLPQVSALHSRPAKQTSLGMLYVCHIRQSSACKRPSSA